MDWSASTSPSSVIFTLVTTATFAWFDFLVLIAFFCLCFAIFVLFSLFNLDVFDGNRGSVWAGEFISVEYIFLVFLF